MKTYIKKKAGPKKGPKYRTLDHFKASKFSAKSKRPNIKFNPSTFRVQHRG